MPNEFVTVEYLFTFVGMVLVLGLIVQFTKSIIKKTFTDQMVRVYAFVWAMVLVGIMYWNQGLFDTTNQMLVTNILLALINAMVVTLSTIGGYELVKK